MFEGSGGAGGTGGHGSLTCDLDVATDGTAACPVGCVSDEVAASCTGTATAPTCDLNAGTDGNDACEHFSGRGGET